VGITRTELTLISWNRRRNVSTERERRFLYCRIKTCFSSAPVMARRHGRSKSANLRAEDRPACERPPWNVIGGSLIRCPVRSRRTQGQRRHARERWYSVTTSWSPRQSRQLHAHRSCHLMIAHRNVAGGHRVDWASYPGPARTRSRSAPRTLTINARPSRRSTACASRANSRHQPLVPWFSRPFGAGKSTLEPWRLNAVPCFDEVSKVLFSMVTMSHTA